MKAFVVPLADLERGPKHAVWSVDEKWIDGAMEGTDAKARGVGSIDATLTKNDKQVLVKGTIKVPLTMPCARTMEPVDVDVESDLLLMLSPAPASAPTPKRKKKGRGTESGTTLNPETSGRLANDRYLSEEEAAQDHFSGDEIVLDSYVREFILLDLPMVPVRSDLREKDKPAIPGPPEESHDGSGRRIDPRLAPLAEIAGRLKNDTKE